MALSDMTIMGLDTRDDVYVGDIVTEDNEIGRDRSLWYAGSFVSP